MSQYFDGWSQIVLEKLLRQKDNLMRENLC
ncbi:hypothetical protein ERO13_D09G122901v2 [Gossypium hirsutum]|nr:hypothetical protein ERO13_D09G122901v2 [Gossypium hirsutum]